VNGTVSGVFLILMEKGWREGAETGLGPLRT
jgi:hypothetical protein